MLFVTDESELKLDCDIAVLYFYANWMPFNKKMLLMLSKIEEKNKNIIFYGIDTDVYKNLCKRFSVEEIPTIIALTYGKEIKRVKGVVMASALKSAFNDILNKVSQERKL